MDHRLGRNEEQLSRWIKKNELERTEVKRVHLTLITLKGVEGVRLKL